MMNGFFKQPGPSSKSSLTFALHILKNPVNPTLFGRSAHSFRATEDVDPIGPFLRHHCPISFWLDPGSQPPFHLLWKAPSKVLMPVRKL
jgi:hypothetical protein